eukprot:Gb_16123 [translate_table: standard]
MSMASALLMTPSAGLFKAFPATKAFNSASLRPSLNALSLSLSSSWRRGGYIPLVLDSPSVVQTPRQGFEPVTTVAAKGYKMKTHKASAKRFRVTGNGKIVRRRAGKQHLLTKKNTKRKNRLSKMTYVDKSDYNNVIGALPYLKVNRKAT